jgi:hypothetical protein
MTTSHSDAAEALTFFERDAVASKEVGSCALWWIVVVSGGLATESALREFQARRRVEQLAW